MGTTSHAPAVVLGLAGAVSEFISKMERDLGVDGTELTVLFCLVVAALIVLLLVYNRASKRKALRLAHAGSFAAHDPFARSFRLQRSPRVDAVPDPVTHGPARDISNPRYRPEIQLPAVPDPAFPTLEEVRVTALVDEEAYWESAGSSTGSNVIGINPVAPGPGGPGLLGVTPLGSIPAFSIPGLRSSLGSELVGTDPLVPSPASPSPIVAPASNGQSGFPTLSDARLTTGTDTSMPKGNGGVAIATAAPLPGWYEDPTGAPGSLRYWDGNAWTVRQPA